MMARPNPNSGPHQRLFDTLLLQHLDSLAGDEGRDAQRELYKKDMILWAVERLGVPENTLRWSLNPGYADHKWDGTPDPFVRAAQSLAEWRNVGIESATGTGKTFFLALATLWFLDVHTDPLVVTTAPKEAQLTLHMWKELGRLWPKFQVLRPSATLTKLRILLEPLNPAKGMAVGFACGVGADEESATKAQGFHADNMMIITEETPGIHRAIMTAFEHTSVGEHNIRFAVGNPDSTQDELHRFCESPYVDTIRVSSHDHPNIVAQNANIIPGAVSKKSIDEKRSKYGPDSRLYRSRVRGLCPEESSESLIRWSLCRMASHYPPEQVMTIRGEGPNALGVDVANSENGDKAAIAHGFGGQLLTVHSFQCPDANVLGLQVTQKMVALGVVMKHCGVDTVGVGAGTYNEMKRLGFRIQSLNGGEKPKELARREEEFNNLRSQMWWQLRVDLEAGRVALPDDEELWEDISSVHWETRNGKIVVESKEKIKIRLGRSPDKGDAAVYWNWVRQSRGASTIGGAKINI